MQIIHLFKKSSFYNVVLFCIVNLIIFFSIFFYCDKFLEPKAYDFLVRLTANNQADPNIVTVHIDDQSIEKIGRWPWNRSYYADMIEYLEKYSNAKVVALDSVIISNNNVYDDFMFINRVKHYQKLIIGVFFSKNTNSFEFENNEYLNSVMQKHFSVKVNDMRSKKYIESSKYLASSYTIKNLMENVNYMGSVLAHPDRDGVIRNFEPIFYYKGAYYLSMPLAIYHKALNVNNFTINDNYIYSKNMIMPIVTNKNGSFSYIKWYKPDETQVQSHKSYSAWKVIRSFENIKQGKKPIIPADTFKNKIVIIGATATALKDIRSTSISPDYPGVDIQATIINNIMRNTFMKKPAIASRLIILASIVVTLLIAITVLSPIYSIIVAIFIMLGYFQVCIYCYSNNFAVDVITPQLILIYSLTVGYGVNFFIENKNKTKIQNIMAKYVSTEVMNDILKDIEGAKLGGKKADISVLFVDIRNFTTISESLPPEKVSSILNTYFSEIVPIILKNHGMLNKFMGDAILAVFGAPVENKQHPLNAVKCGLEILQKIEELRQIWQKEGKPDINIGIGVNTGVAFVGNIGSVDRLEYTVIGDTVNTAYRLDSLNKQLGTRFLISDFTYKRVENLINAVERTNMPLKGKSESISIYEVKELKS